MAAVTSVAGRSRGGTYSRDPVSVALDDQARRLLERAYASPGTWVAHRLFDPPPAVRQRYARWYGIDVAGPDNAATLSGRRDNMRSRWARGFARSLWWNHRNYYSRGELGSRRRTSPAGRPLQVQAGRRLAAVGILPPSRWVRVRVLSGGQAKLRAVARLSDDDRIAYRDGPVGGRWNPPEERDW